MEHRHPPRTEEVCAENSTSTNSIRCHNKALEKERLRHKSIQDAKDQEFADMLKSIEMASAKRNHSIKATKKILVQRSKEQEKRRLSLAKEQTQKSLQLHQKDTRELHERLEKTFRTLELNSNAHDLDEWCHHCQCIHTSDVVKDHK